MAAPADRLSSTDVEHHVRTEVFAERPDDRVGLELEWLTTVGDDRRRCDLARAERIAAEAGPLLTGGGAVTIEPGGQLELSTGTADDAPAACAAAATDLHTLEAVARRHGVELVAVGTDPSRSPARVVTAGRYQAMERYFDPLGHAGLRMMTNSASIQLNVGYGEPAGRAQRWRLANALGPPLVAAFANSPFEEGRPTGWRSSRLRSWWTLDPSRTLPVPLDAAPEEAWTDYALAARVMLIRRDGRHHPVTSGVSFAEWIDQGHELGYPDLADLRYHLTTLFPPVRPRGWFELRMFDALPTPFWHVAVAVTTALLDGTVTDEALDATMPVSDLWMDAAQLGLAHPALAGAALTCFELARARLVDRDDELSADLVDLYLDRWVRAGRCPADDLYDRWRATGEIFPTAESPIPLRALAEATA